MQNLVKNSVKIRQIFRSVIYRPQTIYNALICKLTKKQHVMNDSTGLPGLKPDTLLNENDSKFDRPPGVPRCTWVRQYGEPLLPVKEFKVSPMQAMSLLKTAWRLWRYIKQERSEGRLPILDPLVDPLKPVGGIMGVPIGGIGSGAINRGWRGDFCRWTLVPGGIVNYRIVDANQFSLYSAPIVSLGSSIETGSNASTGSDGISSLNSSVSLGASGSLTESGKMKRKMRRKSKKSKKKYQVSPEGKRAAVINGRKDLDKKSPLQSWNWNGIQGANSEYHALFPRSWNVYNGEPDPDLKVTCKQLSPVLPHNYKESSYPVGVFIWTVENTSNVDKEVSIMFTWQNGTGDSVDKEGGHKNKTFRQKVKRDVKKGKKSNNNSESESKNSSCEKDSNDKNGGCNGDSCGANGPKNNIDEHDIVNTEHIKPIEDKKSESEAENVDEIIGVVLDHDWRQESRQVPSVTENTKKKPKAECVKHNDLVSFAVVTKIDQNDKDTLVTFKSKWLANDKTSAQNLWTQFSDSGTLDFGEEETDYSRKGEIYASALAVKKIVKAGQTATFEFALSWDAPIYRFYSGNAYYRRYTRFYGIDGDAAIDIARDALYSWREWDKEIEKWQDPIVNDESLPNYYKMALFNELYFITDGGTIWTNGCPADPETERKHCQSEENYMGHFAYLEGHEYLMLNTYDVHFYASYALAMLWPMLELSLQRDIGKATLQEIPTQVMALHTGDMMERKAKDCVPHDIGNPGEDPFKLPNSYCYQRIDHWKDLNSKFVLQIYRDFYVTQEKRFLKELWPIMVKVMRYAEQFDTDGDCMIENGGFPDQTYDAWAATGVSAYCGGLWLAALKAMAQMSAVLNEDELKQHYEEWYSKAKDVYEHKLWNGSYYNYDSSTSKYFDSIQSDMLAGQWYSKSCGLGDIVPPENARKALRTIYDMNVCQFKKGTMGAINGMRLDGSVDKSNLQSAEVWTGTTYGVAAAMIQEGLVEEGFNTLKGIVDVTYYTKGYAFQTPEAWDTEGRYRAIGYMRPLAIWAVQYAWELRRFTKPTLSQVKTETKKHPFHRQSIEQLVTSDNPFLPVEEREEYLEQYVDKDNEDLSPSASGSSAEEEAVEETKIDKKPLAKDEVTDLVLTSNNNNNNNNTNNSTIEEKKDLKESVEDIPTPKVVAANEFSQSS